MRSLFGSDGLYDTDAAPVRFITDSGNRGFMSYTVNSDSYICLIIDLIIIIPFNLRPDLKPGLIQQYNIRIPVMDVQLYDTSGGFSRDIRDRFRPFREYLAVEGPNRICFFLRKSDPEELQGILRCCSGSLHGTGGFYPAGLDMDLDTWRGV